MALHLETIWVILTTVLVLVVSVSIIRRLPILKFFTNAAYHDFTWYEAEPTALSINLASALPEHVVILPRDKATFRTAMNHYWAQQEREIVPTCFVRPQTPQQLCTAVSIIKNEFNVQENHDGKPSGRGLFAVRSGGHSPVPGAATTDGGVVIDLSFFNDVEPAEDGLSVTIGAGAKWMDVSKTLDRKGLAVVGGRNSEVGVGGLILGGKFNWQYEVILASGSLITASASTSSDLWRALKGGGNNFGIVTRFKVRSFPSTAIWSGFLYLPSFQASKVLAAFHECVNRANPLREQREVEYDSRAAGPIACFSYIHKIGFQIISVNLVHIQDTDQSEKEKWPNCWQNSKFASLWRLWSTCKSRSLTDATDELSALNPPGRRQVFATTTIKNHTATITATHAAYEEAITRIRRRGRIKGLVYTLVLQPLLPEWACKGDPNPLGLAEHQQDDSREPLVIVSFTVNWDSAVDDEFMKTITRQNVEQIERIAGANGMGHRYRYLNYCAEWQRPFDGYGGDNLAFLRDVSRKYDPEGLFQRGCRGGFKLDMDCA
ncbi:MAG: hypothetical protein Q9227_005279 [Pyrenula ochraceoflavens]